MIYKTEEEEGKTQRNNQKTNDKGKEKKDPKKTQM